jgi:hypothetical protein
VERAAERGYIALKLAKGRGQHGHDVPHRKEHERFSMVFAYQT